MSTNPYASKAMLVLVGFSKWEPRKYDKKVSQEVADKHKTDIKAGRYNKRLFIEPPASLQAVHAAINAAADAYYSETLPWSDDGCRLLPSINYLHFCDVMRAHQARIETAVRAFVPDYPAAIDLARNQLNGMFNEEDYPPVSQIADRFGMVIKFQPVPEGKDFRVELGKEHVAQLRQQIDADTQRAMDEAVEESFGQLFDATEHMVTILTANDPKRSIKDVLIENTRETVERIKRLNLTNNPKLVKYGEEIIKSLCASDGQTLRSMETVRESVAREAARLTAELAKELGIAMPQAEPVAAEKPVKKQARRAERPVSKAAKAKAAKTKASKPAAEPVTAASVDAAVNDLAAMMGMSQ